MFSTAVSDVSSALTDVVSKATSEDKAHVFLFVVLQDIYGKDDPHLFIAREQTQVTAKARSTVQSINAARKTASSGGDRKAKKSPLTLPSRRVFGKVHYNGNFVFRTDDKADEIKAYKEAFKKTEANGGLLGLHDKLTKARADVLRDAPLPVPQKDLNQLPPLDVPQTDLDLLSEESESMGLSSLDMLSEESESLGLSNLDLLDEASEGSLGLGMLDGLDDVSEAPGIEPSPPQDSELSLNLDGLDDLSELSQEESDPTPQDEVPVSLRKAWETVSEDMKTAVNDTDNQLNKLREKLMSSSDQRLITVGNDFFGNGYPKIHGGHKVSFLTKLLDVERTFEAEAYKKALQSLYTAADNYEDYILSSAKVAGVDSNPGHKVGMRDRIGGQLTVLKKEVSRQIEMF